MSIRYYHHRNIHQSQQPRQPRLGLQTAHNPGFYSQWCRQGTSDFQVLPSLETYGSENRTEQVIRLSLENYPDLCGANIMSSDAELSVLAIERTIGLRKLVKLAHERIGVTENALRYNQLDAVIAQNTGQAVKSAIRIMKARCERREPFTSQETIRIEILLKQNL